MSVCVCEGKHKATPVAYYNGWVLNGKDDHTSQVGVLEASHSHYFHPVVALAAWKSCDEFPSEKTSCCPGRADF